MTDKKCFIDVDFYQLAKYNQNSFGDVFVTKKVKEEDRLISVLSDGLGSGIKANVLATLTSTMAVEFMTKDIDMYDASTIIMDTLPVCKERKISYSTFTIVDIQHDLMTRIIEYDNPAFIKVSGNRCEGIEKKTIAIDKRNNRKNFIKSSRFKAVPGDRIIFFSDGVTQSGLGSPPYPLGWGEKEVKDFVLSAIADQPDISSRELARKIVHKSRINDEDRPKDDISCGVIYFRDPRSLLIVSGPPLDQKDDPVLAQMLNDFPGKKVICGGTTSNIIARELGTKITTSIKDSLPHLPPVAVMEGADLITEGIITLSKISTMLEHSNNFEDLDDNGPIKLINLLLDSDNITFVVGTRINEANHHHNMPVEFELRRTIIKKIISLLEKKYFKETHTIYM